jgi:hypothetical protein
MGARESRLGGITGGRSLERDTTRTGFGRKCQNRRLGRTGLPIRSAAELPVNKDSSHGSVADGGPDTL